MYFHVINKGPGLANGDVPDSEIEAQMALMNAAYASAGFRFELVALDRTTNANWFNMVPDTKAEKNAKAALHQGGANALNIYTGGLSGLLGYSSGPADYAAAPTMDGVVIAFDSLPGGTLDDYNGGATSVHETGHWLGLEHTFFRGCKGKGDGVDDTPAEATYADGCPVGRDSCPDLPGLDPINNYMDYTIDSCMTELTPGQATRMKKSYKRHRKPA